MMVAEAPFRSGAIQREAGFEDRSRLNQEAKAIAVPESLHGDQYLRFAQSEGRTKSLWPFGLAL
jgi:hypothetical protein